MSNCTQSIAVVPIEKKEEAIAALFKLPSQGIWNLDNWAWKDVRIGYYESPKKFMIMTASANHPPEQWISFIHSINGTMYHQDLDGYGEAAFKLIPNSTNMEACVEAHLAFGFYDKRTRWTPQECIDLLLKHNTFDKEWNDWSVRILCTALAKNFLHPTMPEVRAIFDNLAGTKPKFVEPKIIV